MGWADKVKQWENESKGGKSGNGSPSTNGTGAGGPATGYTETPKVQEIKNNLFTGKFGDTLGAGSYEDFQKYYGNKTGTYIPEGLPSVMSAPMQGTESKKPATMPEGYDYGKSAFDTVSGLGSKSTLDIIDFYTDPNNDKLVRGAGEYMTRLYQDALDNPNSDYNTDVATRVSSNLNDPEKVAQYIYDMVKENNLNDEQANDILDYYQNMQVGDSNDNVYVIKNYYDDIVAKEEENKQDQAARNRDRAAGGNGIIQKDLDAKAQELFDYLGTDGSTQEGLYEAVKAWQEETGATNDQAKALLSALDVMNAQYGTNSQYMSGYSGYTPESNFVDPTAQWQDALNTNAEERNELQTTIIDVVNQQAENYAKSKSKNKDPNSDEYKGFVKEYIDWADANDKDYIDAKNRIKELDEADVMLNDSIYNFGEDTRAYEYEDPHEYINQALERQFGAEALNGQVDDAMASDIAAEYNRLMYDWANKNNGGNIAPDLSSYQPLPSESEQGTGTSEAYDNASLIYAYTDFSTNPFSSDNIRQARDARDYDYASKQAIDAGYAQGTPEYTEVVKDIFLKLKAKNGR